MSNHPLLELEQLHINSDQGQPLVNGISLRIGFGERWGLVGMSGSGKSLTASALINLPPAGCQIASGKISYFGKSMSFASEAGWDSLRGNKVGFVFQDPSTAFNPVLKLGLQVGESLEAHAPQLSKLQRQQRVLELLHEVGLDNPQEVANSYPHQQSGGMLQRAMIAAAIAGDPELVIADEPTTALDLSVQATILDLVSKLCSQRNMALLWISHDLGVVSQLCQNVAIMKDGELVEVGNLQSVFSQPRDLFTRELLSAVPKMGEA